MIQLSLPPGIGAAIDETESLILLVRGHKIRLTDVSQVSRQLLMRLANAPLVLNDCAPAEMAQARSDIFDAIGELAARRMVQLACVAGGHDIMQVIPLGGPFMLTQRRPRDRSLMQLSRFIYLRRLDQALVVEVPHRYIRVHIADPDVVRIFPALARPVTMADLESTWGQARRCLVSEITDFLAAIGVISIAADDGSLEEDTDWDIATREFHDVAFHAKTRQGLTDGRLGATFPFLGIIPPSPALKPAMSGETIRLPIPDMAKLMASDPPLAQVMEERRSVREYGSARITLAQLSEFLYRVCRVRATRPVGVDGRLYEVTNRTYPSGGASYDIEIYLTVVDCSGIDPGIYHYDADSHVLELICRRKALVQSIGKSAMTASGQKVPASVVVTLASRFSRLSWKYRAISYATTLKNVGVLYEAMYLATTAMGLAPCALGAGDSAAFARATGLNPLVESSVGEFMLGSRRLPEE